ncbi:MAG: hypothetical protein QOH39_593 [Verrucomicrobiota bacterium]|jgi:hypothetical protein
MKTNILAISLALSLGLSAASAGQVDPRFRGVWAGEETFVVVATSYQYGYKPLKYSATLAIGEEGKLFGVLKGIGTGRYYVSPWSNGNKLVIKHSPSIYGEGRYDGNFVLSADGNTLTETGLGLLPGSPLSVTCSITGTFHRQGKK